jgi:hypothetical protein
MALAVKQARSRHPHEGWIRRAQMIALNWDGLLTAAIAQETGCHSWAVRKRLLTSTPQGHRHGVDGCSVSCRI